MKKSLLGTLLAGLALSFTLAACSSDEDQAVTITFRPQVGTEAFSCTATYTGFGTTASDRRVHRLQALRERRSAGHFFGKRGVGDAGAGR